MSEYARRATGSFTAVGGRSTGRATGRGVTKSRSMSGPEFRKYMMDNMRRAEIRALAANTDAEKRKHLTEAIRIGRIIQRMDKIWPTMSRDSRAEAPERR